MLVYHYREVSVSFLCGRAGVCALGAAAAKKAGDQQLVDYYLFQFQEVILSSLSYHGLIC